jgi:glycosyltransferase involved in cell wall biosynthesis
MDLLTMTEEWTSDLQTGSRARPLRILGICPHTVENLTPTTGFGTVASYFFRFLSQQHQVTFGNSADIGRIAHYYNRLRSLALRPRVWRRYAGKNPWIFQARSRVAHRLISAAEDDVDLVIQFWGMNAPFVGHPLKPYAIYTDYVTRLGDSHNYAAYRNSHFRSAREREHYYHLEGETYRRASRIFTWNEIVRRAMIEDYGVDPEKVISAGVGVCIEPIDQQIRRRYDSRQIVFVGQDKSFVRKGVANLLAAFKRVRDTIPDAQLVLVGLKPDRVPAQPGVVNIGFLSDRQKLRQILEQAALYAMTPLIDPSPGVIREAMAMKLPVVASRVDGIPEMVIDGETGYLVPPEEPGQLAEAIIALLQDEDKMRRMGERGYARVQEQFTWERVMSKIEPHLYAMVGATEKSH